MCVCVGGGGRACLLGRGGFFGCIFYRTSHNTIVLYLKKIFVNINFNQTLHREKVCDVHWLFFFSDVRYHLRGIHHLVFYSLPLYAEFYPELVNMLEEVGQMGGVTCTVLYSRYELHMLSRIVGNVRACKMMEADDNVHMVVMGT